VQRGLGDICRLADGAEILEQSRLIVAARSRSEGIRIFSDEACQAFGQFWWPWANGAVVARHNVLMKNFDVDFCVYLERSIDRQIIGSESVIQFSFDLVEQAITCALSDDFDLCLKIGKDVMSISPCTVRNMHDVWMGERDYRDALKSAPVCTKAI